MPPRPSFQSVSSLAIRHPLSQPCIRSSYSIQQVRTLTHDAYQDRKNKALAWLGGAGQAYKRPLGAGRTNYLSGKTDDGEFSLRRAAVGQEGEVAEDPREDDAENPWDDEATVEKLKTKYNVSDEQVHSYTQKYQGLTPAILNYVLQEGLQGEEIERAIQDRKIDVSDKHFDAESIAREEAAKRIETERAQDKSDMKKSDTDILRPFALNRHFAAQPVLSEELREMIYLKVNRDGLTVRTVSSLMGVSMERVGAVVRMKQMERDWIRKGKPLAVPYSKAILNMMPTTPYVDPMKPQNVDPKTGKPFTQKSHEPINELPVHPATAQQLFLSVPESRHFTREDAAKGFHPKLKSADERIPHPELLEIEKFKLRRPSAIRLREFTQDIMEREKKQIAALAEKKRAQAEEGVTVYKGARWNFRFQDVSVDDVGKNGRGRKGVGWRYGMPHEDRKRGQVKIPTSVS